MKLCLKYYGAVLFLTTCHGLRLSPQDNINSKLEYNQPPPIILTISTPNTTDESEEVFYNQSTTKENTFRAAELPSTKAESGEESRNLQIEEEKFESKILSSLNETNQLIREINSTLQEQKFEIRNITAAREIDSQKTSELTNQVQQLNNRTALWELRHHEEINRNKNLSLHLAHAFNWYGSDSHQHQSPFQIAHTTPVPCNSEQFYCSESSSPKCIPRRYVCDGDNDCGNHQDEWGCSCSSNKFACMNGTLITKCIFNLYVCDGDNDCGNFQDEVNCNTTTTTSSSSTCQPGTVACTNNNWNCIRLQNLCDRENDCGDNEDEMKCTRNGTSTCPHYLYSCSGSQRCISKKLLCDGNNDCGNNDDEKNCEHLITTIESQSSNDYFCRGTRKNITSGWVCDGDDDCGDNEDEENCFKNSTNCKIDSMFVCEGTDKCFQYRVVCNGKDNCGNGYDESCPSSLSNVTDLIGPGLPTLQEREKGCRIDKFSCYGSNVTKCISKNYVCDGDNDCGDYEDEQNCTTIKIRRCNTEDFACRIGNEITKCIKRSYLCDGNNDCGDGQDELNCNINTYTCPVGQIACPGVKKCIDIHKLCDRRNDCGKNQDEEMCTRNSTSCPLKLFSCPSSDKCISRSLICDGNNDCGNNEDEQDCGDEANRDRFVCVGTGRVISKSSLCDGHDDCGNNADERNCNINSTSCKNHNLFHCESTEDCISLNLVCNGKRECDNGEDEKFCGGSLANVYQLANPGLPAFDQQKTLCRPGEFLCPGLNTTKCIPETFVCDGINNCGNKADEGNCTELRCGRNRIACSDDSKCVSYDDLCDRKKDCRNKYDESLCTRNSTTCPYEMFTCKQSNRCISPRLVCDGNKDCEDNEDEENCRGVCNEMEFQCPGTAKCISKYQMCDGKGDCDDKKDESNCNTNSTSCPNGMFLCESSGQCISQRLVCNGFNDCLNNEDERVCSNIQDHQSNDKLVSPGLPLLEPLELGCSSHEFFCPKLNRTKCISKENVCDGNNDCGNREDETSCHNKCFVGQFFCKGQKKCIPDEDVCDGESDCLSDEDETGCSHGTNSRFNNSSSQSGCPTYEKIGILNIPSRQLVPGGSEFSYNEGTRLYICRAFYKGNYIPGKYHVGRKSCHVTWKEVERSRTSDFQVMSWKTAGNSTLKWVKQAVGVPEGVVEGGRTAEGDKLHVVRCKVKGNGEEYAWVPGSYDTRLQRAFVGHDLEQLACNEYFEFLTCA